MQSLVLENRGVVVTITTKEDLFKTLEDGLLEKDNDFQR